VERDEAQGKTEFIWDANGRLVESVSDGKKTLYQYDPLGRRISKETDGVVTRFYWDGDALLGDVTGDDTREWVYYPGSFEPLAMLVTDTTCKDNEAPERIYYYANDPNGCPTRLLDETGKVVWAALYDAWGKVKKLSVNEVDQPLRLQGQYFDAETGLYYNRFRYYCPETGSFISQDPLGLVPGENIYTFAPNIQGWVDPLGLSCDPKSKKAIVIGEGMGRVKTAVKDLQAKGINARWYQTWSKNWPKGRKLTPEEFEANKRRNLRWIESKIKKGYDIYDIGPDGRLDPSPFYQVEQNAIKSHNYPTIKLEGY
jgi:RHS repeat-associated protein